MVGYDNLIMGAAVPGLGGDGILAGDARLTVPVDTEVKKSENVKLLNTGESHVDTNFIDDGISKEKAMCVT